MRDDQTIQVGRNDRLSKPGVTSRERIPGGKAHREILDRLLLAVGMDGVQKADELGKRGWLPGRNWIDRG